MSRTTYIAAPLALLISALLGPALFVGCTSTPPARPSRTAASTAGRTTSQSPAGTPVSAASGSAASGPSIITAVEVCPDGRAAPHPRALVLTGPDGVRLDANSYGAGPDAVVFLHETGQQGMCGFAAYAAWLSAHYPVLAVLVDRCGYGTSTCPDVGDGDEALRAQTVPAIDWARAHGARRVALVGASSGGSDALQGAGAISGLSAVVDLSGDGTDTGAADPADARRDHVPTLFAIAPGDPYASVSALRQLYAAVPTARKSFVLVGSEPAVHGWDLLLDGTRPTPLATTVAHWVTR